MTGFSRLNEEVIRAGLCTDCGTCAAVCPKKAIRMNYELEEAELAGECAPKCSLCSDVCPGRDIDLPALNLTAFGRPPGPLEQNLGVVRRLVKAYATESATRDAGAGGGVVSALLICALERGLIDGAVEAGMNREQPWRVEPRLATTRAEVLDYAQSKYSIAPTNAILAEAVASGKKALAVVGLPCHVHALRKMQALGRPKRMAEAVKYSISLLCGTNSHHQTAEHLIEEGLGVALQDVAKLEFRGGGYPGSFRVTRKDGTVVSKSYATLSGAPFYRDRCQMCYDYPGELADVAAGDYYHSDMKPGVKGWSCLIIRSEAGDRLVAEAESAGYIHTEPVEESYLLGLGWENKRHLGVFRLLERARHGWPTPDYHLPLAYPQPLRRNVSMKPPYAVGEDK
jgi:coenzyme F420 hydrogenase subunit beta